MKKWISFLMCLALVMTLALPAFAQEDGTGADSGAQTQTQEEGSGEGTGGSGEGSGGSGEGSGGSEGHTHTWVKVVVPSTCTEEGGTVVLCAECETVDSVVVSPKLSHTYDNTCDPDCNVCKGTREVTHKFSAQWSKNSRKHWHACSVCGAKDGESDHYPGPAATEERDQFCLTCGLLMTRRLTHTHEYGADWVTDESGHWYACQGCEEKKDFEYHVYDDLCDPECNICGYEPPTAHSFDEQYSSDEAGHWTLCVLCGDMTEEEAHVPAENVAEDEALLCTVCGYELAPAKVHVHEFAPEWLSDAENHWKECDCGEVSDNAAHTWGEGAEDEESGVVRYLCTACGQYRTEPMAESEFPWMLVLAGAGVAILGCIAALIFLLKPKKSAGRFGK